MDFLFSQTGILSIVTLAAIFGGMGWFIYKMYTLSAKPAVPLQDQSKHAH
ncbi:hypothetical protein [Leucothrix pacifica]|nr:hypothetical protein [Leucothrix pacifica]